MSRLALGIELSNSPALSEFSRWLAPGGTPRLASDVVDVFRVGLCPRL